MKHYNSIATKEKIDAANLFTYEVKGITLDWSDLIRIHSYYEAACTAEYIMDNYPIEDREIALSMGYDVRRRMDKVSDAGEIEMQIVDELMEDYGGTYAVRTR